MIRTVIYDIDGTLIDSEGAIALAAKEALVEWGVNCTLPDFLEFTGRGDDLFIGGVARKYGVAYSPEMKRRAYAIYLSTAGERVRVYDWSRRLIGYFAERGFQSALASASDRVKVMANIRLLGFEPESFGAVVTANDVTKQKPDPEIFLKAAALIGSRASETLVFEDSLSGVRAARAAGMACIAVPTSYPAEELTAAGANLVLSDPAILCGIFDLFDIQF